MQSHNDSPGSSKSNVDFGDDLIKKGQYIFKKSNAFRPLQVLYGIYQGELNSMAENLMMN